MTIDVKIEQYATVPGGVSVTTGQTVGSVQIPGPLLAGGSATVQVVASPQTRVALLGACRFVAITNKTGSTGSAEIDTGLVDGTLAGDAGVLIEAGVTRVIFRRSSDTHLLLTPSAA